MEEAGLVTNTRSFGYPIETHTFDKDNKDGRCIGCGAEWSPYGKGVHVILPADIEVPGLRVMGSE